MYRLADQCADVRHMRVFAVAISEETETLMAVYKFLHSKNLLYLIPLLLFSLLNNICLLHYSFTLSNLSRLSGLTHLDKKLLKMTCI